MPAKLQAHKDVARLSKENEELKKAARARESHRKFSGHMVSHPAPQF
jgi:hypothetical protein